MPYTKNAFTLIELVFVIVALGILSAIAIPKFAATRIDAQIAKGRGDVAAIRSAIISERQTRLLQGQTTFISTLHSGSLLFNGDGAGRVLLQYGVKPGNGNGHWSTGGCSGIPAVCIYTYTVDNTANVFTYTQADGRFMCSGTYCNQLAN